MDFSRFHLSQYDTLRVERAGPTACFRACRAMAKLGWDVDFPEGTQMRIQVADSEVEGAPGEIRPSVGGFVMGRALFYERLTLGLPLIVGINYRAGSQNRDGITDHFLLLCGIDGELLVGLNPGAEMHGKPYNAAYMEDAANHCWRAVKPAGLHAVVSMIVPPTGWVPK